jgi:hypothetical protein
MTDLKTTEQKQLVYIQKQIDYTALNDASKIEWIPQTMKLTLERYAKIAKKMLKKAET